MYPYAAVEPALATFFGVEPGGLLALRARVRNLQRLGLATSAPGRGKRVQYSFDDVCDLALALSLSRLGVDPLDIVAAVHSGISETISNNIRRTKGILFYVYNPDEMRDADSVETFLSDKKAIEHRNKNLSFIYSELKLREYIKRQPRFTVVNITYTFTILKNLLDAHITE